MTTKSKFNDSHHALTKSERIIVWLKTNILVVLAPGVFLAANHFFYIIARLISHNIFSGPSVFLNIATP
jgi:hypothetical protein